MTHAINILLGRSEGSSSDVDEEAAVMSPPMATGSDGRGTTVRVVRRRRRPERPESALPVHGLLSDSSSGCEDDDQPMDGGSGGSSRDDDVPSDDGITDATDSSGDSDSIEEACGEVAADHDLGSDAGSDALHATAGRYAIAFGEWLLGGCTSWREKSTRKRWQVQLQRYYTYVFQRFPLKDAGALDGDALALSSPFDEASNAIYGIMRIDKALLIKKTLLDYLEVCKTANQKKEVTIMAARLVSFAQHRVEMAGESLESMPVEGATWQSQLGAKAATIDELRKSHTALATKKQRANARSRKYQPAELAKSRMDVSETTLKKEVPAYLESWLEKHAGNFRAAIAGEPHKPIEDKDKKIASVALLVPTTLRPAT